MILQGALSTNSPTHQITNSRMSSRSSGRDALADRRPFARRRRLDEVHREAERPSGTQVVHVLGDADVGAAPLAPRAHADCRMDPRSRPPAIAIRPEAL